MVSLAPRSFLRYGIYRQLQLQRQLSIPSGKERQDYIDAGGSTQKIAELEKWAKERRESMVSTTERYRKAYDVYYGKDRDFENYPTLKQPASMPKVRMGFLPDSWFQAFYEKTGVTGPYLLALGIPLFLVSKEFWVLDPEGVVLLIGVPFAVYATKKWGPKLKELGEAEVEAVNKRLLESPLASAKEAGQQTLELVENKLANDKIVFEEAFKAKSENIGLQLEADYRRRLAEAGRAVERRLTYHIELANNTRRFQQDYLINWVVDSVTNSITPQQEKQAIQQCIGELRNLAANAKV